MPFSKQSHTHIHRQNLNNFCQKLCIFCCLVSFYYLMYFGIEILSDIRNLKICIIAHFLIFEAEQFEGEKSSAKIDKTQIIVAYSIYIEENAFSFFFSFQQYMTLARVAFLEWMFVPYWVTHRSHQSVYFRRNFPLTKSGVELEFTFVCLCNERSHIKLSTIYIFYM